MYDSEDYLNIDTPENVIFGYEVAGIGSRFLAAAIDTILIVVLQALVNFVVALLIGALTDETVFNQKLAAWLMAGFGLISFSLLWGYYILFEISWNGQTPGKRRLGLRVLCTDGTPITAIESIIRNLIRLIDFLPFMYGIGVMTMFINSQARRLGDLAAGTLVVYDQAAVTLDSLADTTRPAPAPVLLSTAAADLPVERLREADIEIVEDFLRRRAELSNRAHLADRLLKSLYKRMELSPPPGIERWREPGERLLAEIVHLYRNRSAGE